MKRLIISIFLLSLLAACASNNSVEEEREMIIEVDSLVPETEDTVSADSMIPEVVEELYVPEEINDLRIYRFGYFPIDEERNLGFVSLTDRYWFREEGDSSIIAPEMREKPSGVPYNMHTIKGLKREIFFIHTDIQEDEKVFIYNFRSDTLFEFNVSDLNLIAKLSPYISERDFPTPEHYFMVGFEFPGDLIEAIGGWDQTLVYIGEASPFNRGKAVPMIFNEIAYKDFPTDQEEDTSRKYLKFSHEEYDYYTHTYAGKFYFSHTLMVIHRPTGDTVLNQLYGRGEGSSATQIFTPETPNPYNAQHQWTGRIFKERPMAVLGMENRSFGCEAIDFLGKPPKRIYFYCDNRH